MIGSVTNRIMENGKSEEIKVGMGATIFMYSDRVACTIIEVSKSGKSAVIQRDKAKAIGGAYSNEWELSRDENGMKYEIYCRNKVYKNSNGETVKIPVWKVKDSKEKVIIGKRMEYYDYEF